MHCRTNACAANCVFWRDKAQLSCERHISIHELMREFAHHSRTCALNVALDVPSRAFIDDSASMANSESTELAALKLCATAGGVTSFSG